MIVGVLAVQGDFEKHIFALKKSGATPVEVRTRQELDQVDGLIIPGGESTTIIKMLKSGNIFNDVKEFVKKKPVFGTCAGSIILSKELANPDLETLDAINIKIQRNAYGTQVDSFIDNVAFNGREIEAFFIRAPKIVDHNGSIEVLIRHRDDPVLVRQDNILACTFHPELTDDLSIHQYFLGMF